MSLEKNCVVHPRLDIPGTEPAIVIIQYID